jgi:hypothetical protein
VGTAADKKRAEKKLELLVTQLEKLNDRWKSLVASRDRLHEGGQGLRLTPTPHPIYCRPNSACAHHSACSTANALMHLQPSTCQPRPLAVQQALRGCLWQLSLVPNPDPNPGPNPSRGRLGHWRRMDPSMVLLATHDNEWCRRLPQCTACCP